MILILSVRPMYPMELAVEGVGMHAWAVRDSGSGAMVRLIEGNYMHCTCVDGAAGRICSHVRAASAFLLASIKLHGFSFFLRGDAYVDHVPGLLWRRGRLRGERINWYLVTGDAPFTVVLNAIVAGESVIIRGLSRPITCLQVSLAFGSHPCIKYLTGNGSINHVERH
ncbi:MAG: hypothetical protein RXO22_01995 [Thermocladium sp.]|jgi:hypothetical protein|nr:MAG: hypothetical protein AT710_04245 [Thermocladium sp. ECH_B]